MCTHLINYVRATNRMRSVYRDIPMLEEKTKDNSAIDKNAGSKDNTDDKGGEGGEP
jgi:hypothetical protein